MYEGWHGAHKIYTKTRIHLRKGKDQKWALGTASRRQSVGGHVLFERITHTAKSVKITAARNSRNRDGASVRRV